MERIFELADALEAFLAWSDTWDDEANAYVTRPERIARIGEDAKAALDIVLARANSLIPYFKHPARSFPVPTGEGGPTQSGRMREVPERAR